MLIPASRRRVSRVRIVGAYQERFRSTWKGYPNELDFAEPSRDRNRQRSRGGVWIAGPKFFVRDCITMDLATMDEPIATRRITQAQFMNSPPRPPALDRSVFKAAEGGRRRFSVVRSERTLPMMMPHWYAAADLARTFARKRIWHR